MTIYLIEFKSEDGRWIPSSHPYYRWDDAQKSIKGKPLSERSKYRVAEYSRVNP